MFQSVEWEGGETTMKKMFLVLLALAVAVSFSSMSFAGETKKAVEKAPAVAPATPATSADEKKAAEKKAAEKKAAAKKAAAKKAAEKKS
jgi:hypothetical protein